MKPPTLTDLVQDWLVEEKLDRTFSCDAHGIVRRRVPSPSHPNGDEVVAIVYETFVYFGFSKESLGMLEAARPDFFLLLRALLKE